MAPRKALTRRDVILYVLVPIVVAIIGTGVWQGIFRNSDACQIKITELAADRRTLEVNQSTRISVRSDVPGQRSVTYTWQTTHGNMNPSGLSQTNQSTYTAPSQPVDDTVSVTVAADGCISTRGEIKIASIPVNVSTASSTPLATSSPGNASNTILPAEQALLEEARLWSPKFSYTYDNGDPQGWAVPTFEDDFGLANTSITPDGKYRWELVSKKETTWWVVPPSAADISVADFYATVIIQKMPGSSPTSNYGLLIRSPDDSNFYHFRVRPNGQLYSAFNFSPSGIKPLPNMEPRQSDVIQEDKPNKLTVIAQGPAFYFYINDQFISKTVDDRLRRGRVLIAVALPDSKGGEKATFEFDNFEVRVPMQQ